VQDRIDYVNAVADAEIGKLMFAASAPAALAAGAATVPIAASAYAGGGMSAWGWGALGVTSAIEIDYAQSAGRGYFNGFVAAPTLGGSLIGERNYAIASLGFGLTAAGIGATRGFGRVQAAVARLTTWRLQG
jgi:hypothetical protein